MPFGLIPEILDPIAVSLVFDKHFSMIDAKMVELGDIKCIVGAKIIRLDHTSGHDMISNDRQQGLSFRIRNYFGVHFPPSRQDTKDGNFPRSPSPASAFSSSPEIGFIGVVAQLARASECR